jgi:hypothetical protein
MFDTLQFVVKICHKSTGRGVFTTEPTQLFGVPPLWQSADESAHSKDSPQSEECTMNKPINLASRVFQQLITDYRFKLVAVAAALSVLWACYDGSPVSYSNPQESSVNQWLIEVKTNGEAQLQLTMRYTNEGGRPSNNNTGFRVPFDQLVGLSRDQAMAASGNVVQFQLKRDAGTFNFEGWFKAGNGAGHFTFTPNSSFASELTRQGFARATDKQLLRLALSDIGFALINELRAQGYEPFTLDQLVRMGEHGVRPDYVLGLKSLGYTLKSTDELIRMRDHGVTLDFIRDLSGMGYTNMSPAELVKTRDHGVTPDYINQFIAAGYEKMPLDEWIRLRDHGVSVDFIEELKPLGYTRLPLDDLRRMRDHGVTPSFIQEFKDIGYDRTPIDQLIRLRDHGVTASFIRKMKEKGYTDLSLDEYIRLRDQGTRE